MLYLLKRMSARLGFFLLLSASFLGNYLSVPLINGIDFIFGSVFVYIVIIYYGTKWGVLTAVVSSSYTYILWGHPYAMITFIFEALFIGLLIRRNNYNIVFVDSIYWLFIGIPLNWSIYYGFFNLSTDITTLLFLKQSINGIFNALIANIFIDHIIIVKHKPSNPTSLKRTIFNIIVILILLPALIFTAIESKKEMDNIRQDILARVDNNSKDIRNEIYSWQKQMLYFAAQLSLSNNISEGFSQRDLEFSKELLPYFQNIYITDTDGSVLASTDDKGILKIGSNIAEHRYFEHARSNLQPVFSKVITDKNNSEPFILTKIPILKEGRILGFVIGEVRTNYLSSLLNEEKKEKDIILSFIDDKHRILASSNSNFILLSDYYKQIEGKVQSISPNIYRRTPSNQNLPVFVLWDRTSFFKETHIEKLYPLSIVVEIPFSPYFNSLIDLYISKLTVVLFFSFSAIGLSAILSQWILNPLTDLSKISSNLPEKIKNREIIEWPKSSMSEMIQLINNVVLMSDKLKQMFQEVIDKQKSLEYLAHYDPLTNLPNRLKFNQELYSAISDARKKHQLLAVIFIDIDRFKRINDTLGHYIGDKLLQLLAKRLEGIFQKKGIVSRHSGDEFIILVPNIKDEDEAKNAAKQILQVLSVKSYDIEGHELAITASIGIAIFPSDANNLISLVKHADVAMYYGKKNGGNNYKRFTPSMNEKLEEKLKLENELRKGIEGNQFILYYQPKLDLTTGKIVGAEALLRWQHPKRGLVSPAEFISLAEELRLIIPIGEWALKTACMQNKAWQDEGLSPLRVSVNVSGIQFQQKNFNHTIEKILTETGLAPRFLELEITENFLMDDKEEVTNKLNQLKDLGIIISIDDFGTGFSSLSYLRHFPIDVIKIDRSFVNDIMHISQDSAVCAGIIDLAKSLNLEVIAEGVETEEQINFLKIKKCDQIQGYYISHPLPADEFIKLLFNETQNDKK